MPKKNAHLSSEGLVRELEVTDLNWLRSVLLSRAVVGVLDVAVEVQLQACFEHQHARVPAVHLRLGNSSWVLGEGVIAISRLVVPVHRIVDDLRVAIRAFYPSRKCGGPHVTMAKHRDQSERARDVP